MNEVTCPSCGHVMVSMTIDHRYLESGLDNVLVKNVPAHRCTRCEEELVELRSIEELHRAIALALVERRGALQPREIRFLRKYLGYSNVDFARKMRVTPETASRWSSEQAPLRMSGTAEQLLRLLVWLGDQIKQYPLEGAGENDDGVIAVEARNGGWMPVRQCG